MSLQTDRIFFKALNADSERTAMLGAKAATATTESVPPRLYNTAIPLPDEDAENVPAPYVIITFDSLQNDESTKDSYEGDTDTVQIGIEVVAVTRPQLTMMTEMIRKDVREFFENYEAPAEGEDLTALIPYDYRMSATAVIYDGDKPAYWQTLNYQCDTQRDFDYEQD